MNEEELRQYGHIASLEISNMQHTIDNLQQENSQLKDRIEKAIKHTKQLREKYFRMCVAGSNNDLSELIEILKGE